MSQFTPEVDEQDVERVLARDFPVEHHQEIREMIQGVEVREKHRVVLACMKNAGGDVRKLKGNLHEASGYYREIISEAEYPSVSNRQSDRAGKGGNHRERQAAVSALAQPGEGVVILRPRRASRG